MAALSTGRCRLSNLLQHQRLELVEAEDKAMQKGAGLWLKESCKSKTPLQKCVKGVIREAITLAEYRFSSGGEEYRVELTKVEAPAPCEHGEYEAMEFVRRQVVGA